MQDRRRVLSYIELEDIPSSATEITSDNYGTVYGNVCYIPLNGQYTMSTDGFAFDMKFQSLNNLLSLCIISLNDIPVLNITSLNDRYVIAHMPTKFNTNPIQYSPFEFYISSYWYGFPFGDYRSYSYRMPFIYPEDTILYIKVKFDRNVTVLFTYNYMISWFLPIYIDNE